MTISPFYSNRVIRRHETIAQIAQVPGRNSLIKVSGSPPRSQNRLQRSDARLQLCLLNLINLGSAQGAKSDPRVSLEMGCIRIRTVCIYTHNTAVSMGNTVSHQQLQ